MTFYEAALQILQEAGQPLTHGDITHRSIERGLLSHIGGNPETTMLSRLAAMAKRPKDKKLVITAPNTFALAEWLLPEDAIAAAATGVYEEPSIEDVPQLRPPERHPEPKPEMARGLGRQTDRYHRRDEEPRRSRRFPQLAEAAAELLKAENRGLTCAELLTAAKERQLMAQEVTEATLLGVLLEDNVRRLDAERAPLFHYQEVAPGRKCLATDLPIDVPGIDVVNEFCRVSGLALESVRRESKPTSSVYNNSSKSDQEPTVDVGTSFQNAKLAVREHKKQMARALRQKLRELPYLAFEKSMTRLLYANRFRDIKSVKRGRDTALYTSRFRDGSLEMRAVIRIIRHDAPLEKKDIIDARADQAKFNAHLALVISTHDARGDVKQEACQGGPLVQLWAADALGEKCIDAEIGVESTKVHLLALDETFFEEVIADAEELQKRREQRMLEREGRSESGRSTENAASASEKREMGAPSEEAQSASESSTRRRRRRRRRGGRAGKPQDGSVEAQESAAAKDGGADEGGAEEPFGETGETPTEMTEADIVENAESEPVESRS